MLSKKNLIILRHAQAKNASISEHDHNRSLTLNGREEAMEMGEILAGRGLRPDYVLCSTATRTRETMAEVQHSFSQWPSVSYSQKIYNATESDLLQQLYLMEDDIANLLIVGHNPGLYQLALALAKDGDKQMHNNLQMDFPTCALVVINFEGSWQNILNTRSKLVLFATPKKK